VDHDPVMVGVIRQYPGKMGALAITTAEKVMRGEQVPAQQPITPGVYTKEGNMD
jgi:ribose transport system substrate-binding protein